jgi:hypothetical protein
MESSKTITAFKPDIIYIPHRFTILKCTPSIENTGSRCSDGSGYSPPSIPALDEHCDREQHQSDRRVSFSIARTPNCTKALQASIPVTRSCTRRSGTILAIKFNQITVFFFRSPGVHLCANPRFQFLGCIATAFKFEHWEEVICGSGGRLREEVACRCVMVAQGVEFVRSEGRMG